MKYRDKDHRDIEHHKYWEEMNTEENRTEQRKVGGAGTCKNKKKRSSSNATNFLSRLSTTKVGKIN